MSGLADGSVKGRGRRRFSSLKRKIAVVVGTRPEAIKMAPVVAELRQHPDKCDCLLVATAQHREMLDQVLEIFGVKPDVDLNVMRRGQGLADLTVRLLANLESLWRRASVDLVLVQGDTTSALVASLAAFYLKIPIGHVEAGLRTGNKYSPFPEEMNRCLVDTMADYCFAPTERARLNLVAEGIANARIFVTGNTGIDALLLTLEQVRRARIVPSVLKPVILSGKKVVLVTAHRRESFGDGVANICAALAKLARTCPGVTILYPVHPNPNVWGPVRSHLAGIENIHLTPPLDYVTFVAAMASADVILTDSGGIQEEAPSLGKPVLVMRESTERTEAVDVGVAELVGTDTSRIVERTVELLKSPVTIDPTSNPFGDGRAASRIVRHLLEVERDAEAPADALLRQGSGPRQ